MQTEILTQTQLEDQSQLQLVPQAKQDQQTNNAQLLQIQTEEYYYNKNINNSQLINYKNSHYLLS